MFCQQCGAENDIQYQFCLKCGAKLSLPVISTNQVLSVQKTIQEQSEDKNVPQDKSKHPFIIVENIIAVIIGFFITKDFFTMLSINKESVGNLMYYYYMVILFFTVICVIDVVGMIAGIIYFGINHNIKMLKYCIAACVFNVFGAIGNYLSLLSVGYFIAFVCVLMAIGGILTLKDKNKKT